MSEKLTKCPNFTRFLPEKLPKYPNFHGRLFARKINKIPEFYMIFARKMPEVYIIIARKIFLPKFRGHMPSLPSRLLHLWPLTVEIRVE